MQIVADTHVHIYPFYRIEKALESVLARLTPKSGPLTPTPRIETVKIACLTERYDCDVYRLLQDTPPEAVNDLFEILSKEEALLIRHRKTGGEFYLLPGQQIITSENIEVLSLSTATRVTEGQNAAQTVRDVLEAGGLPVVAWAPGKWFGERGKVVRQLLNDFSPEQLALGDTTLRPLGWMLPNIMRDARKRGFRILYGSDPLPFKGEEIRPGTYRTVIRDHKLQSNPEMAQLSPALLIRNLLKSKWQIHPAGSRGRLLQVLQRLVKNHRAPKPARTEPLSV